MHSRVSLHAPRRIMYALNALTMLASLLRRQNPLVEAEIRR
jgi:hypothetical protein